MCNMYGYNIAFQIKGTPWAAILIMYVSKYLVYVYVCFPKQTEYIYYQRN